MKWFLQVLKIIRHSQNWDLSHNIIIIVLLECHHTKTIACHLFAEISRKKNNRFYMLQDNKCVLNCLYFHTRTYTDVFYMYCILFVLMFMYILVFRYMFLSWLWILVLIAVFFVSNLMYCFLCFVRNDKINKLYIYISIFKYHIFLVLNACSIPMRFSSVIPFLPG